MDILLGMRDEFGINITFGVEPSEIYWLTKA